MSDKDRKEDTPNTDSERAVYDNCQPVSEQTHQESDMPPPADTREDD